MADPCLVARKQDLPPPGGYKPIPYKRIPAKTFFSGYTMFAGYVAMTTGALYCYYLNNKQITRDKIEMRSAKLAIYPMLLAERDREYLKQLRRNRDAEAELMANVPGWEPIPTTKSGLLQICGDKLAYSVKLAEQVGTYYGEKVYKLLPEDTLVDPIFHEYYAHSSPHNWFQRAYLALRS